MTPFYTRAQYEAAAETVRSRTHHRPRVGLILGSGLNPLAQAVESADSIPYEDVPSFPKPTVEGHVGRLILGLLEGMPVIVMQGRVHLYEGYTIQQVVFPIRVMQVMGIETLIVTNAAGGLNPAFRAGELMLIADHINLMGMTGNSPLFGPNDPTLGPRFPNMSQAYDPALRRIAREVAQEHGLRLHEGVYIGLTGPSFETPADVRFLRLIGADAVGMSTVPEVTVARHGGIRVMGVSGISNMIPAGPAADQEASHEEVLATGRQIVPRLTTLVRGVLARLKEA
jgi:purine-nucleoside phosphorylase